VRTVPNPVSAARGRVRRLPASGWHKRPASAQQLTQIISCCMMIALLLPRPLAYPARGWAGLNASRAGSGVVCCRGDKLSPVGERILPLPDREYHALHVPGEGGLGYQPPL